MEDKVIPPVTIESQPGCVAGALVILGNKWTALIVMELANGPLRFCQIETALPGISPRTLSQRLDDLESCAIVTKQSFAEVPPRVEYALTDKGLDLIPILQSMAAWGNKYHGQATLKHAAAAKP
jgi:DNA-binding HxlR family transcriptional regulator